MMHCIFGETWNFAFKTRVKWWGYHSFCHLYNPYEHGIDFCQRQRQQMNILITKCYEISRHCNWKQVCGIYFGVAGILWLQAFMELRPVAWPANSTFTGKTFDCDSVVGTIVNHIVSQAMQSVSSFPLPVSHPICEPMVAVIFRLCRDKGRTPRFVISSSLIELCNELRTKHIHTTTKKRVKNCLDSWFHQAFTLKISFLIKFAFFFGCFSSLSIVNFTCDYDYHHHCLLALSIAGNSNPKAIVRRQAIEIPQKLYLISLLCFNRIGIKFLARTWRISWLLSIEIVIAATRR